MPLNAAGTGSTGASPVAAVRGYARAALRPVPALVLLWVVSALAGCFHIDSCVCTPPGDTDTGPPPLCGNGMLDPGEECEPPGFGGCDDFCRVGAIPDGCGNFIVQLGEECDDGNNVSGDGCSADCRREGGPPFCGDGFLDPGEECDDGNVNPGDGCSPVCTKKGPPVCGNGVVEPGEQCDPPTGGLCDANCQLVGTCTGPGGGVGAPCNSDCDCAASGGVAGRCLTESEYDLPGGYCTLALCTDETGGGTDSCPAGARCRRFDVPGVGPEMLCVQECTPTPGSISGCRTDTASGAAHACNPELGNPAVGFCWRGCDTDLGCRRCIDNVGVCENAPGLMCGGDADCPLNRTCASSINLCYPNHPPGPSTVGGPCNMDEDCPEFALCAGAFGSAPQFWPGGFCTILYCASYDGMTGFSCPAGSVCPALYGFAGGVLNLCTAGCTVDGGNSTCDTDRGDMFDYECHEASQVGFMVSSFFNSIGVDGFCFQCESLFGMQAWMCP